MPTAITWKETRCVKQLTGAQVMAMAAGRAGARTDAPRRKAASDRPGAARRRRGDARRDDAGGACTRPGHTSGNTTWTMRAEEGGRTLQRRDPGWHGGDGNAALVKNGAGLTPLAQEYIRSFKLLRSIPCDVPLGSHSSMYNMTREIRPAGQDAGWPQPLHRPGSLSGRTRCAGTRIQSQGARSRKRRPARDRASPLTNARPPSDNRTGGCLSMTSRRYETIGVGLAVSMVLAPGLALARSRNRTVSNRCRTGAVSGRCRAARSSTPPPSSRRAADRATRGFGSVRRIRRSSRSSTSQNIQKIADGRLPDPGEHVRHGLTASRER